MKIDLNQELKKIDGTPLMQQEESSGSVVTLNKVITLKSICINALFGNEKDLSGDDKMKRYLLAIKIEKGSIVDFSTEEIVLLKKLINQFFPTIVAPQCCLLLEKK